MILLITPHNKFDHLANAIIYGIKKLGVEIYCTNQGNGAINIISDEEFKNKLDQCKNVIVLMGKAKGKYYLLDSFTKEHWNKTAVVDGSEWSLPSYMPPFDKNNLIWWDVFGKAKWYFKRECYPEHAELGIIPFPFALLDSDFGNHSENKTIDVLCGFGNIRGVPDLKGCKPWRQVAIDTCNELKKEGYNIITTKVSDYLRTINKSWITIDAFGGGEFNARTLQIRANKSLALQKKFGIIYPHSQPENHYIEWDTSKELKDKIRFYLMHKHLMSEIIDLSYKNVLEYHTAEKRVEFMLKTVGYL